MKRLIGLALVFCLLLSLPASALDVEAVVGRLIQTVQDFMKQEQYKYEVNSENSRITAQFSVDSAVRSCELFIQAYYDMLRVSAVAPEKVPEAQRDEVAKLLVLINYEISYATFHMDYEDGEVSCIAFQYVESVLPGVEEVKVMVQQPLIYMEDYGDAIVRVAKGEADAQQAYDEAVANIQ